MDRLTDRPFPPYTYVPGTDSPHPIRESNGHSFEQSEPDVGQFDPVKWDSCTEYLYGVDLFNSQFYWESHEQWEAVWHAVGRRGHVADFLKGLIKLSAAGVKLLEGQPNGLKRHAARASELFELVAIQSPQLCGFSLCELAEMAKNVEGTVFNAARDLGVRLHPTTSTLGG